MSKDIYDFVKVYNEYSNDDLELVLSQLELFDWDNHKWYGYDESKGSRQKDEFKVSFSDNIISNFILERSMEAVKKYTTEFIDCGFQGICKPRFNRYDEQTNMARHVDHIRSLFDGKIKGIPVLSVLTLFNDDYEGGEFVFNESDKFELKAGDVLIFPSVFMFPHRVNNISKGTRYSCISWTW